MKKIIRSMTSFALVALMLFSISASAYANDYNLSELTVGQDLEDIQPSDTEYNPSIILNDTGYTIYVHDENEAFSLLGHLVCTFQR